jgi:hypothetical protein
MCAFSNHASHCAHSTVGEPIIKKRRPASSEGIRSPYALLSQRPQPGPLSIARRCRIRFCELSRVVPFLTHSTSAFGSEFVSIFLFECLWHQRTANIPGPVLPQRACNAFMAQLNFRQLVKRSATLSTLVPSVRGSGDGLVIRHAGIASVTRSSMLSKGISAPSGLQCSQDSIQPLGFAQRWLCI